jgi:hypothetical protein
MLSDACFFAPGEEDELQGYRRGHGRGEVDLTVAKDLHGSGVFEWDYVEDTYTYLPPPVRELSWDGDTLRLPTGGWHALWLGKAGPWAWWEWDALSAREVEAILRGADSGRIDTSTLLTPKHRTEWCAVDDVEAALLADLEAVRARKATPKPDLTDPGVVYRLGEEYLAESQKRGAWRRFAAYVRSEGAGGG